MDLIDQARMEGFQAALIATQVLCQGEIERYAADAQLREAQGIRAFAKRLNPFFKSAPEDINLLVLESIQARSKLNQAVFH